MATTYHSYHDAVGAWFLGPHAENFEVLERIFHDVLYEQGKARAAYFPNDDNFITPAMKASNLYQKNIKKLKYVISQLAPQLAAHSVPFWNPRYNAHMNMDTTMPGIAGYLMAMMYNPNNVAVEASPLTTAIEADVGKQLCEMVGYNIDIKSSPVGWGHITCDGSVANLESMWAARNLKFYPLSLRLAMKPGRPLDFIAATFRLRDNDLEPFNKLTTWDLLNIPPSVVLSIPDRLRELYSITSQFLEASLKEYLVQSVGKDSDIFQEFNTPKIQLNKMVYLISTTKHYSWPKAAAITGIGRENVINVGVDNDARIDVNDLKKKLLNCLKNRRAVYAVVAIIGSTEHGACDPLDKIVALRDDADLNGLSFVLHADAAWGAYFCSTRRTPKGFVSVPGGFMPAITLKESTTQALDSLCQCDSITVDPHKSGYIQYPAGGLLYRDQRMRYLITWASPIVYRNELESMGIYGIEGSKPGAAPVAIWVSHEVIGLHTEGYGALLGEAVFNCAKMYAHLATMSTDATEFIVVPLNELPKISLDSDLKNELPDIPQYSDLKEFIRKRILDIDNKTLVNDNDAMKVVIKMGSDLAINAFAVNFRFMGPNNQLVTNEDVAEANYLGKRIFERLSISKASDNVPDKPLILTSMQFTHEKYGACLVNFKNRLGLKGLQDLYVLVNVVMSPFSTEGNFTRQIADALQKVIEDEVKTSRYRNEITSDYHGFIMQGTEKLHLVHLPMFNMGNHRVQLIITGDLPPHVMDKYKQARVDFPDQYFTLGNAYKDTLTNMLTRKKFAAVIDKGLLPSDGTHLITGFELTNIEVLVQSSLNSKDLNTTYPTAGMPFYLYGHSGSEYHIDHVLLAAPNTQFTADKVNIVMQSGNPPTLPFFGQINVDLHEIAMQPFPSNKNIATDLKFFFRQGKELSFTLQDDQGAEMKGKLTLENNVFVDTDMLNEDPVLPKEGEHVYGRMGRTPHGAHVLSAEQSIMQRREWQDIISSFPRPYDV